MGGTASARARVALTAAVLGGAVVGLGACLPWLSFYAGLVPMSGTTGLYGRLLVVGGAASCAAAAWAWLRPTRGLEPIIALVGGALVGFAGWLIVQLFTTLHTLQANPMIVPRVGPGLFVALGGSVMVAAGATLAALRRR